MIEAPAMPTAFTARGDLFASVRAALQRMLARVDEAGMLAAATVEIHNAWQRRLEAQEWIAPDLGVREQTAAAVRGAIAEAERLDPAYLAEWLDLLPRTVEGLLEVRSTVLVDAEARHLEATGDEEGDQHTQWQELRGLSALELSLVA